MKIFEWDNDKNEWLKKNRNISFERVVIDILKGNIIDDYEHPNKEKYPAQRIFAIDIDGYVYLVPYIESNEEYFLKTVIPSRKATKNYKKGDNNERL